MAARPTWKGYLKISLVNIPARVLPAPTQARRSASISQVIGTYEGAIDFAYYRDEYQESLREIIEAKIAGRQVVKRFASAESYCVGVRGRRQPTRCKWSSASMSTASVPWRTDTVCLARA